MVYIPWTMVKKIDTALPAMTAYLDQLPQRVFQPRELTRLLAAQVDQWGLPTTISSRQCLERLTREGSLQRVILASEDYPPLTRYVWREASPYALALSIKPGAFLSHGSAVFLHGLNDQLPKTIYVNKEQSEKPSPTGELSQGAMDRAFASPQRRSRYVFVWGDNRMVVLSGKQTQRLEVGTVTGPNGERLEATTVARTLVDIAVRPDYAGGVYQVLAAYEGARERVSVNALMAVLKKLNYRYPYHQVVGFYLTRAGYEPAKVARLKSWGLDFDFYLDYAIPADQRLYDSEWRLFFPKGL